MTKSFPLGTVLSVTTGRLCCNIGEVYEILNHLTGDNLFTHVLPRAGRFAGPLILEQYPELCAASDALLRLDNMIVGAKQRGEKPASVVGQWLESLNLPQHYDIPSYADRWLSFDPIEELATMVPREKIVVRSPN